MSRCATIYLRCATLSTFYPSFGFLFQLSMAIDINCHWMLECYPGLSYYRDRRVHFAMCAGNELFYAMLYLCHFTSGPFNMFAILATLCFPVAVLKSAIACLQVSRN